MTGKIYSNLTESTRKKRKQIALLLDPDKLTSSHLDSLSELANINQVDYIFVGGSLITHHDFNGVVGAIKDLFSMPVVIFPGSNLHISDHADAILLLSLISGRNPELLIGNHVIAAPLLKNASLEIISTGYMLVESGRITSVQYISNTMPIPRNKTDIAVCTAMAGEMLGMKTIYVDAGSGAGQTVPAEMIKNIKHNLNVPLIVGGGITQPVYAQSIWEAGADVIVIGTATEDKPDRIEEFCRQRNLINSKQSAVQFSPR